MIHFIGIGGIGMSALAQLYAMDGQKVSGSDRLINKGFEELDVFFYLKNLGVKIYPQDGSGITKDTKMVVLSSAIEETNPEFLKAKELNIPIVHRSDLLAKEVAACRTVAISGTSGKSTVSAMVFEILKEAKKEPSVITGAVLNSLRKKDLYGNVYKGKSDILVIEADESDGSLLQYRPEIGVCLNIEKDHKEIDVLEGYFKEFAKNCKTFLIWHGQEKLRNMFPHAKTFGFTKEAGVYGKNLKTDGSGSSFEVEKQLFKINIPGEHNTQNALAAVAAAKEMGVDLKTAATALRKFEGVYRRFNIIGKAQEIEVVDDFAHNPHKLAAALKAAALRGGRVLAFFQPHAFASIKLLEEDFSSAIAQTLRSIDYLWLTEVYYPGGTVPEGISAKSVHSGAERRGMKNVFFNNCRELIAAEMFKEARAGDVIIVMGARDPSLTNFAKKILNSLQSRQLVTIACEQCLVGNSCLNSKMVKK